MKCVADGLRAGNNCTVEGLTKKKVQVGRLTSRWPELSRACWKESGNFPHGNDISRMNQRSVPERCFGSRLWTRPPGRSNTDENQKLSPAGTSRDFDDRRQWSVVHLRGPSCRRGSPLFLVGIFCGTWGPLRSLRTRTWVWREKCRLTRPSLLQGLRCKGVLQKPGG